MSTEQPALPRGARVGEYRVESVLGRGSFGITYLVTDDTLGLKLALKEYLPPGLARRTPSGRLDIDDPAQQAQFRKGLKQFLAEGRVIAGLNHPNVVTVVRHFEALGTAYLAMRYYEGEPLNALLRRGGVFNADEINALAQPLLDALDYLHRQGVTHRDIKPANIYVTREGRPILLDFGAARVQAAQGRKLLIGSEGYAAWEQFDPDAEVGPWTDIYGLAATLYRLMSGERPVSSTRRHEAVAGGRSDPLAPLHAAGGIPPRLASAVMQGLALAPGDRPASAGAWRSAFGASTPATPTPAPRRPAKGESEWLPRILAGVVGLVLIAAIVWLLLGEGTTPEPAPDDTATDDTPAEPVGLAEDDRSWAQAVSEDTAAAYRAYLEAFPQGRHADDARIQLQFYDEEDWAAADAQNTLEGYEDYLASWPDGAHRIEAESRATAFRDAAEADDAAWEAAQVAGTVEAIDAYLAAYPQGRNVLEARAFKDRLVNAARDDAAFAAARSINRPTAYQDYLDAFPSGAHVAQALAALDELVMRPGKRFRDCDSCPEMVVLAPGNFEQGSDESAPDARSNETPRHTVRLSDSFAIGVFEVTFDEWDACVAAGGCRAQPRDNGWGRGRRPVIMVTWNDAMDYVGWLSKHTGEAYDLPSESQWEYAARAGEVGDWTGGSRASVCAQANVAGAESGFPWRHDACSDPFSAGTATVGYFDANAYGVHDMIGNVAEWTADCMNLSYLDAPTDGSAWSQGMCASRLTRGGSWFSGSHEIRLPARFHLRAGERNDFTGFRVVRKVRQ